MAKCYFILFQNVKGEMIYDYVRVGETVLLDILDIRRGDCTVIVYWAAQLDIVRITI